MDSGQNPTKTVLELALELGVRTEAVLSCLQKMGAEPEDISSAVDSSLEDILIDQMVSEGIVPTDSKVKVNANSPMNRLPMMT